jgi:hypothetical protein
MHQHSLGTQQLALAAASSRRYRQQVQEALDVEGAAWDV